MHETADAKLLFELTWARNMLTVLQRQQRREQIQLEVATIGEKYGLDRRAKRRTDLGHRGEWRSRVQSWASKVAGNDDVQTGLRVCAPSHSHPQLKSSIMGCTNLSCSSIQKAFESRTRTCNEDFCNSFESKTIISVTP